MGEWLELNPRSPSQTTGPCFCLANWAKRYILHIILHILHILCHIQHIFNLLFHILHILLPILHIMFHILHFAYYINLHIMK